MFYSMSEYSKDENESLLRKRMISKVELNGKVVTHSHSEINVWDELTTGKQFRFSRLQRYGLNSESKIGI